MRAFASRAQPFASGTDLPTCALQHFRRLSEALLTAQDLAARACKWPAAAIAASNLPGEIRVGTNKARAGDLPASLLAGRRRGGAGARNLRGRDRRGADRGPVVRSLPAPVDHHRPALSAIR